jgi:hypothetical protein
MKLKYMIEYALRDRNRAPRYEPIGVWVQGPGPGLDLVIEFLPGNAEAEEEAQWVINRLVEQGVRSLGEDFLDYHRGTLSPYRGMRGSVVETEEYFSAESCAKDLLRIFPEKTRIDLEL